MCSFCYSVVQQRHTDIPAQSSAQVYQALHKQTTTGCQHLSPQDIRTVTDGVFEVRSETGDAVYRVYFQFTPAVSAPRCDCVDWPQ